MFPHLILQAWWSETEAAIATQPTPEAKLVALEARYSITLPDDFRQYLRDGAPTVEDLDTEMGNWWPIERIKNIPDEYNHSVSAPIAANAAKHLIFLDHFMWCWAWAISCADDESRGKVALIGGLPDGYVADSFAEFVERYTTDWGEISQVQTKTMKLTNRARIWTLRRWRLWWRKRVCQQPKSRIYRCSNNSKFYG